MTPSPAGSGGAAGGGMSHYGQAQRVLAPIATGELVPVRVLAVAENWAMVRRPGAVPFVVPASQLRTEGVA